jgi:hypothetical protein
MLISDPLSLLGSFRGAHFRLIFVPLLLRHELTAIDLLFLISREGETVKTK